MTVQFRQPPIRDRARLDFIRSLPCTVCYAPPPSEAAHLRLGLAGGMGIKGPDKWTLPLCNRHHREQHQIGEVKFWRDNLAVNKPLLVLMLRALAESIQWQPQNAK